jgi:hypothetical protein
MKELRPPPGNLAAMVDNARPVTIPRTPRRPLAPPSGCPTSHMVLTVRSPVLDQLLLRGAPRFHVRAVGLETS